MTNFVKIWKNYLTEQILIESRFSDALAYAQNFNKGAKQFRVKDVVDQMSDEQIATLKKGVERAIEHAKEGDPSGDNKYLMWVARFVRKDLFRRLQKYGKQWNTTPLPWGALERDPGGIHDPDVVATNIASLIVDNVVGLTKPIKNYHLLKQKGIIKKDIYDFDPTNEIGDFKGAVEIGMRQLKDKEAKSALEKQAAGEADDLLETEDYAVIRPNSEGASCYYGWGTRWCISAREARNYFNQYSGEGKSFYFVMFRNLPNHSPYKKVALVYGKDTYSGNPDPEEVFDALDNEEGPEGLVAAITDNLLFKIIKRAESLKGDLDAIKKVESDLDRQDKTSALKEFVAEIIGDPVGSGESLEKVLSMAQVLFPDTYADETDFDIQPLQEKFDELVQETYSDIAGNAAYHAEQNPGGPNFEDYEAKFDEYPSFDHIHVNYDEYDTNAFYWDASIQIEPTDGPLEDLHLPEDIDLDSFSEVVNNALSDNGIYPDEVEADPYDNAVRVRLTPDDDEAQGLDGFERFLDRMHEYDQTLESVAFWDDLAEKLMEAGLTAGGLVELRDVLDEIDFKNLEYDITGKQMEIVLEVDPTLARPKGISNQYFEQIVNALADEDLKKQISDQTVNKIEDALKNKYEDFYNQLALPGFDKDRMETPPLDALPLIDMGFLPRPSEITHIGFDNSKIKGGAGINIVYPWNLVLSLTNEQYWENLGTNEDEVAALIEFLKWIDKEEIMGQITETLQAPLNDASLEYIKNHPPEPEAGPEKEIENPESTQQVAEQQLQEVYKRWARMIR